MMSLLSQEGQGIPQTIDEFKSFRDELELLISTSAQFIQGASDLGDVLTDIFRRESWINQDWLPDFSEAEHHFHIFSAQLSALNEVVDTTRDRLSLLEQAEQELAENRALSTDNILKLMELTDNFMDYLIFEDGQVRLNTEAWREYASALMDVEREELRRAIRDMEEQRRELEEQRRNLEDETARLNSRISVNNQAGVVDRAITQLGKLNDELEQNERNLNNVNDELERHNDLYSKTLGIYRDLFGEMPDISEISSANMFGFISGGISDITEKVDNFADGMTRLANLQKMVGNSFTMSVQQALEFASVYPEILNSATVAADGQIKLNADVVNAIIESEQAKLEAGIDARIASLEADKAVLKGRKARAEAELEIANQVAKCELAIEEAKMKALELAAQTLAEYLYQSGLDQVEANKAAAEAMSGDMESFRDIVGNVASDNAHNLAQSMATAADATQANSVAMTHNLNALGQVAREVARQVSNIGSGEETFNATNFVGRDGVSFGQFTAQNSDAAFEARRRAATSLTERNIMDWQHQLTLDVSAYTQAIANINGQISALRALRNLPLDSFADGGSGSGGGGRSVEEYIALINELHELEQRLNAARDRRQRNRIRIDTTSDTVQHLEYMREIIGLYEEEQRILNSINQIRRRQITDNVEQLRSRGFNVDWDEYTRTVSLDR